MPWTNTDPDVVRAYDRGYRQANKDRRKAQQKAYEDRLVAQAKIILGNCCAQCDCKDDLELDHIDGNGKEDRRLANSRNAIRGILARHCDGMQLLCHPCHKVKTNLQLYGHSKPRNAYVKSLRSEILGSFSIRYRKSPGSDPGPSSVLG